MNLLKSQSFLQTKYREFSLQYALFYICCRLQGKLFDEDQIIRELNPTLRREVIWHNTSLLVQSVKLFYDVSDDFIYEIGTRMRFMVFLTGDVSDTN